MDFDDLPVKKSEHIADLEKEDISTLGADELHARILKLKAIIDRYHGEIEARASSKAAAEAIFKS